MNDVKMSTNRGAAIEYVTSPPAPIERNQSRSRASIRLIAVAGATSPPTSRTKPFSLLSFFLFLSFLLLFSVSFPFFFPLLFFRHFVNVNRECDGFFPEQLFCARRLKRDQRGYLFQQRRLNTRICCCCCCCFIRLTHSQKIKFSHLLTQFPRQKNPNKTKQGNQTVLEVKHEMYMYVAAIFGGEESLN